MNAAVASSVPDTFAFLYENVENLFPGYSPETTFTHGVDVVVARMEAQADGFQSIMYERRLPAQCFKATSSNGDGITLSISTGSGPTQGMLLNRLCRALADGSAHLEDVAFEAVRSEIFELSEDGRRVELFEGRNLARLDLEVTVDNGIDGSNSTAFSINFEDLKLAVDVGHAISDGMLVIGLA